MRIYDIIKRKRDGEELTEEEISFFTQSVTNGFASDEQTGAFLMAVYFNGMTRAETLALTNAMAKSGDSLDLSGWGRACADRRIYRRAARSRRRGGDAAYGARNRRRVRLNARQQQTAVPGIFHGSSYRGAGAEDGASSGGAGEPGQVGFPLPHVP